MNSGPSSKQGRGSPLLRVAFCTCGQALYQNKGRTEQYYRCAMKAIAGKQCDQNRSISAPLLEKTVEDAFLDFAGRIEIMRRIFRPGINYTRQIEDVTRSLDRLREDRDTGLYDSSEDRDYWVKAVKSRQAKLTELKAPHPARKLRTSNPRISGSVPSPLAMAPISRRNAVARG
ncbi:zinc ribbon domain-containing protein [Streptomyces mirabilis]|uniref:zinc ribbon domain-containing protein n=1 Tax=Streptomyces mirabilis TaxID=68239 RepID=UPI0033F31CB7